MEEASLAVQHRMRCAALIDGKAYKELLRAKFEYKLPDLLQLKRIDRSDSWGLDDSNWFIVNSTLLIRRCEEETILQSLVLVDVSANLKQPEILLREHHIYEILRNKIVLMKENLSKETNVELLPPGMLDSVLLGWILDYPCIYYSATQNNCLSDIPLLLVSLFEEGQKEPFTSFSVPFCLIEHVDVKQALEDAKEKWKTIGILYVEKQVTLSMINL